MQANLEQNAFRNKSKQIRNNKQNLIMPIVILRSEEHTSEL